MYRFIRLVYTRSMQLCFNYVESPSSCHLIWSFVLHRFYHHPQVQISTDRMSLIYDMNSLNSSLRAQYIALLWVGLVALIGPWLKDVVYRLYTRELWKIMITSCYRLNIYRSNMYTLCVFQEISSIPVNCIFE